MKRSYYIVIIALIVLLVPHIVRADAATHVVISEVQTGSAASASQEFIELYNPTGQPIALDGWQLQYRPAGATSSWTNRSGSGLHGNIPAHGFYLVAPTTYLANADATFSTGMAVGGGSARLMDASSNVIDLVGWGTAVEFEAAAAQAPAAGGSIERLPGDANPTAGNGIDTDNNASDFALRATAEPQSSTSVPELPGDVVAAPGSTPAPPTPDPSTPGPQATAYAQINLNELFIDPVAPQTDAKDEFIELYNPNTVAEPIAGYIVKTGSNFHDSYTLPDTLLAPGGYLVLYSSQTKLSLTNTGGAAELLDPSGVVIDQTADYDGSLPGMSFSRFGEDWQWTTALTPNASNVFVAPPAGSTASATSATTKASAKKSTAKAAAAKTSKVKAAKTVKATKSSALAAVAQQAGFAGKWLIIALAALTLGYAIYEFRYDLQNYYIRGRRKYGAWREARAAAKRQ